MKTVDLNPYLFFDGNCREAMEFYRRIFGGQLEMLTYGDIDPNSPESKKNRIMHSNLMGGAVEFFGGDGMDDSPLGTGKISMTLHGTDEKKLREMFEKLSEGGKIKAPIAKQAWGDLYGDLTDKYNVTWMVNIGQSNAS